MRLKLAAFSSGPSLRALTLLSENKVRCVAVTAANRI